MIKELAEFGNRIRGKDDNLDDALTYERVTILIEISDDGVFRNLYNIDKDTKVEDVVRTEDAGRTSGILPRLLVDNAQYVLGYPHNKKRASICNQEFIRKLKDYSDLPELKPIMKFYENENGINSAYAAFEAKLASKQIDNKGNIAFLIVGSDNFVHENPKIYELIKSNYLEKENKRRNKDDTNCSVCGKNTHRSKNVAVHGVIKRVPDGQSSGCSMVSYNADAFESYGFSGNDNSAICTHCIKNYIIGLNWLLANGAESSSEKNGKVVSQFNYSNRKNLGSDTALVYWTRDPADLDEMHWFDNPEPKQVANLIESVAKSKHTIPTSIVPNHFYSLTLSGAAARIAVRDWIEISLDEYRKNIAKWFADIRISFYDFNNLELRYLYPSMAQLSWACTRKDSKNDPVVSRAARALWSCALQNQPPPLWLLTIVLKRIVHYETTPEGKSVNTFTTTRASLIRFILNRNKIGDYEMKEELDFGNNSPAYLSGRLFAQIEGIQRAALGKDINAGVRERFFSAASTSPSPAFGRLMRLMQNHMTKIRQEKPGLAIALDTEVTDLCRKIDKFPSTLSLEEQGQFALGYYHQKHYSFSRSKQDQSFESMNDNHIED